MNPEKAAKLMTNPDGSVSMEDSDELSGPEGGSAGVSPGDNTGKSIMDRLLNTEPNVPLEQIESPWRPDVGGPTRIYRGVQKLGDIEGLPAIVDIAVGIAETVVSMDDLKQSGDSSDADGDGVEDELKEAEVMSV